MDYGIIRSNMVRDQIIGRGIKDQRVINAMNTVPRHLFVEEALASRAYGDFSLPIGQGQTISQPFMVALMTEALALKGTDKVLEIGTGSGYQTAILSMLCRRIYSIERKKSFAIGARRLLSKLGYYNIVLRACDGSQGWPEAILFDGIIVTAGAPKVPEPLIDQLAEDGRLVIPVGEQNLQRLLVLTKKDGKITQKEIAGCVFVKLIGNHGWQE